LKTTRTRKDSNRGVAGPVVTIWVKKRHMFQDFEFINPDRLPPRFRRFDPAEHRK